MVDRRRTRRHLLRGATGFGLVSLSGCLRMIGGGDSSNGLQDATFQFTQSGERLRIVYEGGGSLVAQQLQIRSSGGTVSAWNQLGSTQAQADTTLSSGESATIGPSVVNWGQPVGPDTTIQVVYMIDGESPSTLATFEPAVGTSQTNSGEQTQDTPIDTSGALLAGDDFEADHGMDPYRMNTVDAESYDWGTVQVDAPDGGEYCGRIMENDSGRGTRVTAISEETIAWNESYSFDFLLRCSDYSVDGPWNKNDIMWRGHREGMTERMLGLRVFDTDGSGVNEPFKWVGGGVTDSSQGYSVDWQPSVWYKIEGYVDEETGDAEAMIWPASESRPDEYQISATVQTGVSDPLPYAVRVAGRRGYKITMDLAHLSWKATGNDD